MHGHVLCPFAWKPETKGSWEWHRMDADGTWLQGTILGFKLELRSFCCLRGAFAWSLPREWDSWNGNLSRLRGLLVEFVFGVWELWARFLSIGRKSLSGSLCSVSETLIWFLSRLRIHLIWPLSRVCKTLGGFLSRLGISLARPLSWRKRFFARWSITLAGSLS